MHHTIILKAYARLLLCSAFLYSAKNSEVILLIVKLSEKQYFKEQANEIRRKEKRTLVKIQMTCTQYTLFMLRMNGSYSIKHVICSIT